MVLPVVVLLLEAVVDKTGPLLRGVVVVDGVPPVEVAMADLRPVVGRGVHLREEWGDLLDMANSPCILQEFRVARRITNKVAVRRIPWRSSHSSWVSSVCPCIFAVISAGLWVLGPSYVASLPSAARAIRQTIMVEGHWPLVVWPQRHSAF